MLYGATVSHGQEISWAMITLQFIGREVDSDKASNMSCLVKRRNLDKVYIKMNNWLYKHWMTNFGSFGTS